MVGTASGTPYAPLDEAARELYLAVLRGVGRVEASELTEQELAPLRRLVEIGLLVAQPGGPGYIAVSPRAVTRRIGAEMRAEAVRLLTGSEQMIGGFGDLIQAYEQLAAPPVGRSAAEHVHGLADIQKRVFQLASECRNELVTVHPGPREPELLEASLRHDVPLLLRGCRMRTIYQPSALSAPATVCYAAEVTKHGGAVRVLDEPFQRTFIIDRRVAVIPGEDPEEAVFLDDPAVVAHLVRVFERDWERAQAPRWGSVRSIDPAAEATGGRVGALMSQGLTQQGVARRLGLSERTVAGHLARLRNRYGARTLFQLGWLMGTAQIRPVGTGDCPPRERDGGIQR